MQNHKKITKAVIAAAGFGTRFLPATKNQPKEMLPIIDKPIIHYLVEEAVESGIKDIIIVSRQGRHILEDYFDNNYELEMLLSEAGKQEKVETIKDIPRMANFVYVRQKADLPYGNGSPLLSAKNLIDDDESVLYFFGDDMILTDNGVPGSKQLIEIFQKYNATAVTMAQEVPWEKVNRYGIFKYKENSEIPYQIESQVEKPSREEAPSNMAQDGRFVLSYKVIEELEETALGKDNELWLTDSLNKLAKQGELIIAPKIDGIWMTTGDPLNYISAMLEYSMRREDLRDDVIKKMRELVEKNEHK